MYFYRMCHQGDLPWLAQAATAAAWESLAPEERTAVHPAYVADKARQQIWETISSPQGVTVMLTRGFRPVGFSTCMVAPDATTGEPNGHLTMVWVDPAHRRQGLGKGLQSVTEELVSRTGVRKMKLWTGLHNQRFVNMAQRMGYKPEGLIGMKQL